MKPVYSSVLRLGRLESDQGTEQTSALVSLEKDSGVGTRNTALLTPRQRRIASVAGIGAFGAGFSMLVCIVFVVTTSMYSQLKDVRSDAHCFRLRRRTSTPAFSVVVSIGSPSTTYELLLDLGTLSSAHEPEAVLFSRNVFLSNSLVCNSTSRVCSDAILMDGKVGGKRHGVFEFLFDETDTLAVNGFDGVLRLAHEQRVHITTTHACFESTESSDSTHEVTSQAVSFIDIVDQRLVASHSVVQQLFPNAPVSDCTNQTVSLFPVESISASWSTVVGSSFKEKLAVNGQLQDRQHAIERGIGPCARNDSITRDLIMDCEILGASCSKTPSLSYRHATQATLDLYISNTGASLSVQHRRVFETVGEEGGVVLRLVVAIIISFVFFTRASFSTSNSSRRAIRFMRGGPQMVGVEQRLDALADLVVGVAALVSRGAAFLSKRDAFRDGGLEIVCMSELAALVCSLLHIFIRNLVLDPSVLSLNTGGSIAPRDRLGGSMALADASVAASIAVCSLPLLSTSLGNNFDDIARLLSGSLAVLFVFVRVLHSLFASSTTAASACLDGNFSKAYMAMLLVSILFWVVQLLAVSIAVSVTFLIPTAYSLSRHDLKDTGVTNLVSLGALCLVGLSVRKSVVRL